ncbi:MAG: hypothetical protein ACLFTT_11080 [Candidatus Hydrogenedentota bacterium]
MLGGAGSGAQPPQRAVVFDFETGDLQGWQVSEGRFGQVVADRARFHNAPETPYNKQGRYFLSTLDTKAGDPNDAFTGVIESPVFELDAPAMSFLVGGGRHDTTCVALYTLDGREIKRASGNDSEQMRRVEWRVPSLVGTRVVLRIVDDQTGGWGHVTFDDFRASGHIDNAATQARAAARVDQRLQARISTGIAEANLSALSAAVNDLTQEFGARYQHGQTFLRRIAALEAEQAQIETALHEGGPGVLLRLTRFAREVRQLRQEALVANPLVSGQPLLYVLRDQYLPDHHNTATLFQVGEINETSFQGGGALKSLDFGEGGNVTTLVDAPAGIVRDPEVSFDGTRIVFSMRRNAQDCYHIYEVNADGTGLRQLTRANGVSDIDPLYLPGGGIVFSSTREPKYCMCNRHIMANLFRMEADGANIHQIGKSTLFEGHSALLPDGRIVYDRWEYVDRNFGDAQALWTVNPDGTNHALYWGNNTNSPGGVLDPRPIPGSPHMLCVFGSCHDRPWGALAIIDRRRGMDGREPVIRTWPAAAIDLVGVGNYDTFAQVKPKYEDPYALSDKYFLCARMTGDDEVMGIYLLDIFGNEILLHTEAPGCFDPMPLGPRPLPPEIPRRRDFQAEAGIFYVADVYRGTHMAGVEPGTVKFLRVVESPEKRSFAPEQRWGGQGQQNPGMSWHDFNNKRILGTVPVAADGSAQAAVPADTFVYFQLLDEHGMMVQSMRSGTMIHSGERQGCIGCHEPRRSAPPPLNSMPQALEKPADRLEGWHGAPRFFDYRAEVQPVFDTHCVSCHDYGKEAGDTLLLSGDTTMTFNTSFNELWRKNYIAAVGAGPAEVQPAYSWGAHASRLVEVIRGGHQDVALDGEEFDRIVTWIDINAPYYPHYETAYPHNLAGRSPLTPAQVARLTELIGVPFNDLAHHAKNRGPQVSFERPELSPCLANVDDKDSAAYREAVAIIEAGKEQLAKRPRADMPGFTLAGDDARRQEKYAHREAIELRNREAVCEGGKVYDN